MNLSEKIQYSSLIVSPYENLISYGQKIGRTELNEDIHNYNYMDPNPLENEFS